MNIATFNANLDTIATITTAVTILTGIDTDEFIDVTNKAVLADIRDFYRSKGVDFDITTDTISDDAVKFVSKRLAFVMHLANTAVKAGITASDLKL